MLEGIKKLPTCRILWAKFKSWWRKTLAQSIFWKANVMGKKIMKYSETSTTSYYQAYKYSKNVIKRIFSASLSSLGNYCLASTIHSQREWQVLSPLPPAVLQALRAGQEGCFTMGIAGWDLKCILIWILAQSQQGCVPSMSFCQVHQLGGKTLPPIPSSSGHSLAKVIHY